MKNFIRSAVVAFVSVAGMAYGGTTPMNVTVSDPGGGIAFKGTTDGKGMFTTGSLKGGSYTVQINSRSKLSGGSYTVVVGMGSKKVSSAVSGEKFNGSGVALKVDVAGGASLTGQVSEAVGPNGKKMVWIPQQVGSNRTGHYAEEGSAEAMAAQGANNYDGNQRNRKNQGANLLGR